MKLVILWTSLMWNIYSTSEYKCSLISVIYATHSTASSFSLTCSRNMKRERDSRTICGHTNILELIPACFIFIPNRTDGFKLGCISVTEGSDIKNLLHFQISVFHNEKLCITYLLFSN